MHHKNKIREHLLPMETIITQILFKKAPKITSNSKKNRQKTEHRKTKN